MLSLLLTQGPLAGRRLAVPAELVVGRTEGELRIDDPLISRRHARLRAVEGALELEDLGSLNGTWVNGERIAAPRLLVAGDVVSFGATTAAVEHAGGHGRETVAAPAPAVGQGRTADELRTITAFFADVVGSTGLGEQLPPHDVKALVGECVTRMSREIERFGGTVQAYMGDGVAAYFGVPVAHEDDPERAARAGLAIVETVRRYAAEVAAVWEIPDFDVRVGLNTGEVATGTVGAAWQQSVSLGDTTNVAARLQATAEPGTISVGAATARALLPRFELEPLGAVAVKGRLEGVPAWRLLGERAGAGGEATRPLVGRRREVARLEEVLSELEGGRGRVVILLGEIGLGKTRLLAELRTLAADRTTWLEAACLSYGADVLHDPFVRILRRWAGVEGAEAEVAVRTRLRGRLSLLGAEAAAAFPALAHLVGLPPASDEEHALRLLPPERLGAELRAGYRAWVGALAERAPVALVLDDLHWADSGTGRLFEELLELAEHAPVLLVGAVRPEVEGEGRRLRVKALTDYAHRVAEIALEPLDEPAARELLAGLPELEGLAVDEVELILAVAEGNPLYLEELAVAAVEGGNERRGDTWVATVARPSLTPTIESLLLARIDRLPPEARRLVQLAAVIGRRFPLRVLQELAETGDPSPALAVLLRADIVREAGRAPEREYVFRHGLVREAALSTMVPARRRELHGAVGRVLESLAAGAVDEHLELLGHHFARSDELPRALDYLERAAARASALGEPEHAAQLRRRALRVAERLGDTAAAERLRPEPE